MSNKSKIKLLSWKAQKILIAKEDEIDVKFDRIELMKNLKEN